MIAPMSRGLVLAASALVTAVVLASSAGIPAQAANTTLVTVARATELRSGDIVRGPLPGAQPMRVVVALKLRNRDELGNLVAAHRTLTAAQFSAQHAPTPVQARTIANYLALMGFTNVVIAPNRLLVSADGTTDSARAAFLTSFARVRTQEGREAYANNLAARIPAALQGSVLSVIGLQNVHEMRGFSQTAPPSVIGHNPLEFSSIYGGNGVPTAAGVTVGILTQGNLTQTIADLNAYTAENGLPTVSTQTVTINGTSGDTSNVLEWNLDSQSIVGMAGGRVGKMIFYNAPTLQFADTVATMNAAVAANAAQIINVSLGACEIYPRNDGSAAAADQILQVAVAQGQTFAVSTGDHGADNCNNGGNVASWPASSPYVVAVAGTTLNASTTTWMSEVVWNQLPDRGATGGSPSVFEPKPVWQNALVPGTKRGVADITFSASPLTGARIRYYGGITQVGGTSLSAPIFVGLWARVIAVKGNALGFAAPLLYRLPATDFHDVVYGNNHSFGKYNGFVAKPGYDFASGRGSVILNRAISHIGGDLPNSPPVAKFSYSALGLVANFSDQSTDADGTIAARDWTFGDGTVSTAINPRHVYAKAGTYSVTLRVTDNRGSSAAKTSPVKAGR